jgi:hypothetical protein
MFDVHVICVNDDLVQNIIIVCKQRDYETNVKIKNTLTKIRHTRYRDNIERWWSINSVQKKTGIDILGIYFLCLFLAILLHAC